MHENIFSYVSPSILLCMIAVYIATSCASKLLLCTVQLTGNVAGTRTMRHASMRETCEGARMLRGIASKTKSPGSSTIANLQERLLLRVLAQS